MVKHGDFGEIPRAIVTKISPQPVVETLLSLGSLCLVLDFSRQNRLETAGKLWGWVKLPMKITV